MPAWGREEMALLLVWMRHRDASGRTQHGFSLGENVTTAGFRKNFLADGARMGRPRKYRSWCWAGTKGIPALGGNWGRMTPGVLPRLTARDSVGLS